MDVQHADQPSRRCGNGREEGQEAAASRHERKGGLAGMPQDRPRAHIHRAQLVGREGEEEPRGGAELHHGALGQRIGFLLWVLGGRA